MYILIIKYAFCKNYLNEVYHITIKFLNSHHNSFIFAHFKKVEGEKFEV